MSKLSKAILLIAVFTVIGASLYAQVGGTGSKGKLGNKHLKVCQNVGGVLVCTQK